MLRTGSAPASAQRPRFGDSWTRTGWWAMAVPSFLSGSWAIFVSIAYPEMSAYYARMFAVPAIAFAHTAGGGVASLIGPFQFHPQLRRRRLQAHRWLGHVYLVAVGLSGLGGIYLSPRSLAANTFGIAFILLALAWLLTGWQAYAAIRRGEVTAHRRWMIRNFALTYAAVTLRIEMPLLMLAGMNSILALNVVGWTCWIPNLLAVEWWMKRKEGAAVRAAPAF